MRKVFIVLILAYLITGIWFPYLYLPILILALVRGVELILIYNLRRKRDKIDFTTYKGGQEISKINKQIDNLNGISNEPTN